MRRLPATIHPEVDMIRAAVIAAVVAVALAAPAGAQSFPSPSRTFKLCFIEDPGCVPMIRSGYAAGHALACRGQPLTLGDEEITAIFMQFSTIMMGEMNNFPPGQYAQIWASYARDVLNCH